MGWFGNTNWAVRGSTSALSLHQTYASGSYDKAESEENRESGSSVQITTTRCSESSQCGSGFACVGGRCIQTLPSGGLDDSGNFLNCGADIGGDGLPGGSGSSGGGGGCGGPGNTSGGGSASLGTIYGCGTASGGSCTNTRGPSNSGSGSGGGGGGSCGARCCRYGNDGWGCYDGQCPPPPPTCSRFCSEAEGLGANVITCNAKKCDICEYCDDSDGAPTCKRRSYDVDCRCDYQCPGCMQCSSTGGCLIKNCPPQEPPPPALDCEPKCTTVWNCDESGDGCVTYEKCEDLDPECEQCDCNCNEECGECETCNEQTGKCENSCGDLVTYTAGYQVLSGRFAICLGSPFWCGGNEKCSVRAEGSQVDMVLKCVGINEGVNLETVGAVPPGRQCTKTICPDYVSGGGTIHKCGAVAPFILGTNRRCQTTVTANNGTIRTYTWKEFTGSGATLEEAQADVASQVAAYKAAQDSAWDDSLVVPPDTNIPDVVDPPTFIPGVETSPTNIDPVDTQAVNTAPVDW